MSFGPDMSRRRRTLIIKWNEFAEFDCLQFGWRMANGVAVIASAAVVVVIINRVTSLKQLAHHFSASMTTTATTATTTSTMVQRKKRTHTHTNTHKQQLTKWNCKT